MKYYFDTNSLRQIGKLDSKHQKDVVTSFMAIFEIISGINSEKEFIKRRSILRKIDNSQIQIIWESLPTLVSKAFDFGIQETDVEATKTIMSYIINANSYEDAKAIEFTILNSEIYGLDVFIDYDDSLSKNLSSTLNKIIPRLSKELPKEIRAAAMSPRDLQVHSEVIIRNFLLSNLNINSPNDRYFECLGTYTKLDCFLDDYFRALAFGEINAMCGQNFGKNDAIDYVHLAYSNDVDYFVSDDNIYNRFPENFLKVNCIKYAEYNSIVNKIS